jgi:hypothetical protein
MSNMDKIPKFLDKRIFKLIFKIGTVSKLSKEERMAYEASLKAKWDTQNAFDTIRKEERVRAEREKLDSARLLKQSGVAIHLIAKSLKLPLEVIEKL